MTRWSVVVLLLLASTARADDDILDWVRVTTVSRDGQRVLGTNRFGGGPLLFRVFSATTGEQLSATAFPAFGRLKPSSRLLRIVAVAGNIPLTAEIAAAGQVLREFSPVMHGSASDDGKTVAFGSFRDKILLRGGALSLLPEPWLATVVMPDGKAILFQTDADERRGLWRYDLATQKSVKLVTGTPWLNEDTRVTADRKTVRVPLGGANLCVVDVSLAGKAKQTCYSTIARGFGMSEDAHWLAFSDQNQTLHIVDLAKRKEVRAVKGVALGDDYKNYFEIDVATSGRVFYTNMEIAWQVDLVGPPVTLEHPAKARTCVATGDRGLCQLGGKLLEMNRK